MKNLSICSFLLLQFILYVASVACAQPTVPGNVNTATNTMANQPNRQAYYPSMLNAAPASRPQSGQSITIEDVWMQNGGVRIAFLSIQRPRQVYTVGYPWIDPASTPLLQPIRPYPPPKKRIVRRATPKKAVIVRPSPAPISQVQVKQGLSLKAPEKAAIEKSVEPVKQPAVVKGKEDTANKFDNLYSVPK